MNKATNKLKALKSDHKNKADFFSAFENAGVGLWHFDITNKAFTFDKSASHLFGIAEDREFDYEEFLNLIHSEDVSAVNLAFLKSNKETSDSKLNLLIRTRSETASGLKLLNLSGTLFFNGNTLEHITGLVLDKSEQLAQESEMQKLRLLVNNSPDFMGISGNDGKLQFVNKTGSFLVGLDEGTDLSTLNSTDFYHEDQLTRMEQVYDDIKEKGSWKGHIFLKHFKTGESIPGYATFEPIFHSLTGELLGRSATVKDLRVELKAQKALLANEAMFRNVTENAPTGLWMSDPEGQLIYLNKTLVDWTGMSYKDLLGFGWANAIIVEDRQKAGEAFLEAVNAKKHYDVEFRINKSDATVHWCRAAGDPFFDDDGNYAGYAGFCMDIHQHVEMSNKVLESDQRTKSIVDQAPVAIGVLRGKDLIIESGNEKILAIWGKDKKIFGSPISKVLPISKGLPEIEGQGFIELLNGVYNTGEPFHGYGVLVKLEHKGKIEDIYVDFLYTPIKDVNGLINGVMVLATDVTTQVLSSKALTESELKFRSLINEAPVATAVYLGRELKIDLANDIMIRYWGKGKQVIGMALEKALPELEGQPFLKILDDVFTTGILAEFKETKVDLESEGVLKTFYFDFTYKALRTISGEIYAILNMAVDVTEQVLSKWELQKSRQQLLTYFEQSPVAIAIIAKENLTFKMVNPFYGELVGRTPEQLENKSLLDALPELKGQGFDQLVQEVIDSGVPYIANEVAVDLLRNGEIEKVFVNLTYQAQRNINSEITGILVVATDVSAQVRARQIIEDSEAKIKSIVTTAPFAISLFIGSDLIIEMPNQAFLEMVGKNESIIGMPLRLAVPEFERESQPFIEFLKNVYNTGKMLRMYGVSTKTDQINGLKESFYDIAYTPIFDNTGKVYAIASISMDVTEQLKARRSLEEANLFSKGAIELANLGTWTLDIESKILDYDQRLRSWFGFDSEELISAERAYAPISKNDHASVRDSMLNAMAIGSDGKYDVEYTITNLKSGHELIIHAQGIAFYNERDEPYKVTGTARDVTKERRIELELKKLVQEQTEQLQAANEELQATNEEMAKTNEELEEANQNLFRSNEELSQYAYVASHDLQEPLRKIRVFSGILSKNNTFTDANKALVEKIDASSLRMSLLIKDLLEFSRLIKSDKMMRPVNLNETIKHVLSDFELIITEKNARINVEQLPEIEAVGLQMNQLFYNLIGNALKFVAKDTAPEIKIGVKLLSNKEAKLFIPKAKTSIDYFDISISDNGIGFESKFSDQIFEVFKRLHGKDIYPGSGIGLALCRRIVNNHGGILYSESTVGEGTTFHVILPNH